jgi:glycosyltransferase involved in cell wall biosynthesis
MIREISFCILNHSESDKFLKRCIESVHSQGLPEYEILVCGLSCDVDNAKYFHKEDWARQGALNKMRNYLCSHASKEFIVLMDSNVELTRDWYSKISRADCFDLIGSRLVTLDNKRVIDWAYRIRLGDKDIPFPLEYDEWTTKAYISGTLMVIQRRVWERARFNETFLLNQNDDVDFCLRASEIGFRIGVFPEAVAIYHCDRNAYTLRKYITFEEPFSILNDFNYGFMEGKTPFNSRDYNHTVKYFKRVIQILSYQASRGYDTVFSLSQNSYIKNKQSKLWNLLSLMKQKIKKCGNEFKNGTPNR